MDSYKVIKKAPVYAKTNGEMAVDYPHAFVDAGKTVSGSYETIFVSTDEGSQDEDFINLGNGKFIKASYVQKGGDVYSKVEGSSNNQNQTNNQKMATTSTPVAPSTGMMSMAKSHKMVIGGLIGAGLGAGYAKWQKKGYLWPVLIGAVGVAALAHFTHKDDAMVAPAAPATPVAPAGGTNIPAASEFAGMNASGPVKKVYSAKEKEALGKAGYTMHKKAKDCFYPTLGLYGPCGGRLPNYPPK